MESKFQTISKFLDELENGNLINDEEQTINIIHSLSDTSKKYKILKNFFT